MHHSRKYGAALLMLAACGGASEPSDVDDARPQVAVAPAPAPTAPPVTSPTPSPKPCGAGQYVADPAAWRRSGSNPRGYEMNAEPSLQWCAKAGAHMRSLASAADGTFGTFMELLPAAPYLGKRVRLRADVRAEGVTRWAGLWLRVDGKDGPIAFDSMQYRAVKATQDFATHDVVLDVPAEANGLAFGIVLAGSGEVWAKEIVIEVVGKDVPTTGP
jgi:hypothetical protein